MAVSIDEFPYIFTISIASFSNTIIFIYRNYINTPTPPTNIQIFYAWSGLASAVTSIAEIIESTPFLYYTNWGFILFDAVYILATFFSASSSNPLFSFDALSVLYWILFAIEYLVIFLLDKRRGEKFLNLI